MEIIDFGISQFHRIYKSGSAEVQNLAIRSPEVQFNYPYDYKIDIWSVGALWYFMKFGDYLVRYEYEPSDKQRIKNKIYSHIGSPVINPCLSFNPDKRPSAVELVKMLEEKYPETEL